MADDLVDQTPPRSPEWMGNRWAGDVLYGRCSACGKAATAGEDEDDWWHSYATDIVACPARDDRSARFVLEGRFDA